MAMAVQPLADEPELNSMTTRHAEDQKSATSVTTALPCFTHISYNK